MNELSPVTRLPPKHYGFYNRLRRKVSVWLEGKVGKDHKWAEYVLLVPDMFHLVCRLSVDKDVPLGLKTKLAGVIAYYVSPFDLLPEAFLGPVGYLDDLSLAAFALNMVLNEVNPEVLRRHWAGDGDILSIISRVLGAADKMAGKGLWSRVRNAVFKDPVKGKP